MAPAPPAPSPHGPAPHTPAALSGPRRMAMLTHLAWRNVWRNKVRSVLTAGAMVVGLTLMIGALALVEGLFRQMIGFATDVTIGHLQVHRQAFIDDQDLYAVLPWPLVAHLRGRTDYAYAPRLYAAGLVSSGDFSSGAMLRGIDPALEPQVTRLDEHLRAGAFALTETERAFPRGPEEPGVTVYPVLIGNHLARTLQVGVGGEIVLITQAADGSIGNGLFRVRGILQPIDPAFDRMGVVLSLEGFNSLMFLERGAHELAVGLADATALAGARERIASAVEAWPGSEALAAEPEGRVRVRTWRQINPVLSDMLKSYRVMFYVIAVIIFSIAALGMLNTMLMAVYERRHELGILLALGMGRGTMMLMVLAEAFFLVCFASVVGALTGTALSLYLAVYGLDWSRWLPEGLDFMGVMMEPVYYAHLEPDHVLVSVIIGAATTLVAAVVPSWRTARLQPVDVLQQ